ncbi:MAG: glycosyltransferase family 2 protein [Gammaproteobacteria bacterium]
MVEDTSDGGVGTNVPPGSPDRKSTKFIPLGELLLEQGYITDDHLEKALALQQEWGTRLGDILMSKGWVQPFAFYRVLADQYNKPFINMMEFLPDKSLWLDSEIDQYTEHLVLPFSQENDKTIFVCADPSPEAVYYMHEQTDGAYDFVITSKFDIIWIVQREAKDYLVDNAVNDLANKQPVNSAKQVFTKAQLLWIYVVLVLILLSITLWPITALITINLCISVFLLLNFGLRILFAWVGGDTQIDVKVTDEEVLELTDRELPTYTVLVPMYKEPEVLPIITSAIRNLDYPLSKLDVKLILEDDDDETIQAAKELGLEGIFEIIRVPDSLPKTKPKACNYALSFARGELITIYDAEDRPEPDQLKKAVIAFRKAPDNTAVIQARLNYFNANENWLTRMFTLEYSLWFDFYLPALEALKIPIPLGGTSNHFKMHILKEVDAWDPYNVTEDADLGVRYTQLNYRVGVVNSTTYEEANSHIGNWIRQRSRWIKGYMQTYLVHMRHPIDLYHSLGAGAFWGFQFFIGGAVTSALMAPFLYLMYFVWLYTQTHALDLLFPSLILYISLFNLLIGNGMLIYLSTLSVFKRRHYKLIPWALTIPFYWILMSVAAYRALWQLIHNPFYWEKTVHGLTSHKHDEDEVPPPITRPGSTT